VSSFDVIDWRLDVKCSVGGKIRADKFCDSLYASVTKLANWQREKSGDKM